MKCVLKELNSYYDERSCPYKDAQCRYAGINSCSSSVDCEERNRISAARQSPCPIMVKANYCAQAINCDIPHLKILIPDGFSCEIKGQCFRVFCPSARELTGTRFRLPEDYIRIQRLFIELNKEIRNLYFA